MTLVLRKQYKILTDSYSLLLIELYLFIPPSLSDISISVRARDTVTPGKSDESLTEKLSTPSTSLSSMMVMFMQDNAPRDAPERKVIKLGSPVKSLFAVAKI